MQALTARQSPTRPHGVQCRRARSAQLNSRREAQLSHTRTCTHTHTPYACTRTHVHRSATLVGRAISDDDRPTVTMRIDSLVRPYNTHFHTVNAQACKPTNSLWLPRASAQGVAAADDALALTMHSVKSDDMLEPSPRTIDSGPPAVATCCTVLQHVAMRIPRCICPGHVASRCLGRLRLTAVRCIVNVALCCNMLPRSATHRHSARRLTCRRNRRQLRPS